MTDPDVTNHSLSAHGPLPAVGIRELVALPLAKYPRGPHVRAQLVGSRIDTRNLTDFVEPDKLSPHDRGGVFVFRFGVVVFFGTPPEIEHDLLLRLKRHIIQPVDSPNIETRSSTFSRDRRTDRCQRAIYSRSEDDGAPPPDGHRAGAQLVLERDEIHIAEVIESLEPLVNNLQVQGRARMPIRRVMQHIGNVLATQHRVVGRVQISEKPDILWDHPELDLLYARLEAEYELSDRPAPSNASWR